MRSRGQARFEDVVLCHMDMVYRMARTLCKDAHEAEDLVQETFLRAHRAFDRFDLRAYGAKPWLLKILHNAFYTRRGQESRGPTLLDDISFDDFAAEIERDDLSLLDAGGEVNWDLLDQEVKAALAALSPEYRSVLLLWALRDLSYKEIAEVLGCALGTVMSRLYRARQLLNQALAGYAQQNRRTSHGSPAGGEAASSPGAPRPGGEAAS